MKRKLQWLVTLVAAHPGPVFAALLLGELIVLVALLRAEAAAVLVEAVLRVAARCDS